MNGRPPLGLHVEITDANGVRTRWDAASSDASKRPQGITFSSQLTAGFATGSVTLSRRIDREYVDLGLYNDVAFIGDDGTVAYEGRVSAQPRSMDRDHTVSVQCAGWIAHTSDRKFTEIFIDRDLGGWQAPAVLRRADLITSGYALQGTKVEPDETGGQPALNTGLSGAWTSTTKAISEALYDAGPGNLIAKVVYGWKKGSTVSAADTLWTWSLIVAPTDRLDTGSASSNFRAAGPGSGTFTPAAAGRYAAARAYYDSAGGSDNADYPLWWTELGVVGDHGLTLTGTPAGVTASDVIKYLAATYCPKLNTAGVQDTTWPIPHLAFKDRTTPYEAFLKVNAYHLWPIQVWENKTLTYGPVDLTDYDWQVRISDPGVTVSLQGDSTDELANGIAVQFTDLATGKTSVLTPDDTADLADSDPENPANKHSIKAWTEISLSTPTTADSAVQLGRAALAEFNTPKAPGTITVQGHIRDRAGNWQQAWKPRAGETLIIADHANDRPRLITEVSYNGDNHAATITVEGQPRRLEAVLDRLSTALDAANLT